MKKTTLPFLLVLVWLAACGPPPPDTASTAPQSWFDAPLPGAYSLEAIQLVSHHSHSTGIAELEFSVNGEVIAQVSVNGSESLVSDTRNWAPLEPGEYTLRARARNGAGQWGDYAETYVLVPPSAGIVQGVVYADLNGDGAIGSGEGPLEGVDVHLDGCGASQVQTTVADGAFSFTGLPAGSCTLQVFKAGWGYSGSAPAIGYPVPVASNPHLPTALGVFMAPMADALGGDAGFSEKSQDSSTVHTGECSPNAVTFRIRALHANDILGVTFFFRVRQGDQTTPWSNGQSMAPIGDGYYELRLTGNHLENDSGFTAATVLYQFVMEPAGAEIIRSQVFSDLALVACEQQAPQPTATPTPRR